MTFERNVFINCPFDNSYFPILRAILFTLVYLDFEPMIAETTDSGASRLLKIQNLIGNSKYSIHDISRIELSKGGLPRFNMPLECGIDLGVKMFGNKQHRTKSFLILEKEKFRYQKFMSDIAGNDIRAHRNDPELAIKHVRDWIKLNSNNSIDWASEIWLVFNEFLSDYTEYAREYNYDPHKIDAITFADFIELTKEWMRGWRERTKRP